MITKKCITELYTSLACNSEYLFAMPVDHAKFTLARADNVSLSQCESFTEQLTTEIEKYRESFLKQEFLLNQDVEILAISDMIFNAASRPFNDRFQIIIFSGLFTLMSHRLIIGQMVTDLVIRCRNRSLHDAEEHIQELLNLSYFLGFWIYYHGKSYNLRNVVEALNENNRKDYLHALGGSMLFIYLHELGHIKLNHHDLLNRCNGTISKEKSVLMEFEADQFAIDSIKDHLRATMVINADIVFDMINEFELYALRSANGHPLIYRRLERLILLLDDTKEKDVIKMIEESVKKSAIRHHKSPHVDVISGLYNIKAKERKIQFLGQLPSEDECEKGFKTLCAVYQNMQD